MKKLILFCVALLFIMGVHSQVTYTWVKADSITVNDTLWFGDGTYQVSAGSGNWDKSNDTITPIAGVDVVDIRTDTLSADGSLWFTDPHNATNVMIGDGAGSTSGAHGNYSTGVGYQSLQDIISSGVGNTAYGGFSLSNTSSGDNNVGVGFGVLNSNISGSGNVALGYSAAQNWTGSNALFIDNSNTTTPLIFGDFSADSVKIHGTFTTNNAFGEMVFSEADTISTATTSWYSPTKWALDDYYATSVVGDTAMVITQNGWYQVNASPSFSHSGTNVLIHYGVFVNDVLDPYIQAERTIGATGSQFGSASLGGIIKITNAPDTLQLKVNADKTGNLISNHNNVTAVRIR